MNSIEFERVLFCYVEYIKKFNAYLTKEYNLTDIPYNVAGKEFPRKGSVNIENDNVDYRFHGRGCTLFWRDVEIFFNVDSTSIHQIIITPGGLLRFCETFFNKNYEHEFSYDVDSILEDFEKKGVLMTRKPTDLGSFHVNEEWIKAYMNHTPFTGKNKDDIDWI